MVPERARVPLLALACVLLRLPFLAAPLSSDEAGFLMVGAQWSPGTSLYGDYWVDRPPLLITIFRLADLCGGTVALRLVGIVAVVLAILAAAGIGRLAVPGSRHAPLVTAAVATVFLASPLYGARQVNGELLAMPFVLGGLWAVLRASSGRGGARDWAVAGVLAACAVGVKQSMVEVAVAAVATVGWLVWHRRWRAAVGSSVAFAAAVAVTVGLLLGWADLRGTTPAGLWDAVVKFRGAAAEVIARSATDANEYRAHDLVLAFLASGSVGLLVAVLPLRWGRLLRRGAPAEGDGAEERPATDLGFLAAAVVAWEAFAVVVGGSYWIHYLVATVPGLVLVAAATARYRPARLRWTWATLAYAAVVAVTSTVIVLRTPSLTGPTTEIEDYLAARSAPGDTGVVAFGFPGLLRAAGLSSPYPHLWSLPVRVRDPDLVRLTRVLSGEQAPTWVVVDGDSTTTWGVDGTAADEVLAERYEQVRVIGDWHVFRLALR
ncbi:MAG TPA: hypothetical protein VNS55_00210 [Nocardioides sp.]|nr:hypothetical protein [Nocardioides sp.]